MAQVRARSSVAMDDAGHRQWIALSQPLELLPGDRVFRRPPRQLFAPKPRVVRLRGAARPTGVAPGRQSQDVDHVSAAWADPQKVRLLANCLIRGLAHFISPRCTARLEREIKRRPSDCIRSSMGNAPKGSLDPPIALRPMECRRGKLMLMGPAPRGGAIADGKIVSVGGG
jgi:hypothetical protein